MGRGPGRIERAIEATLDAESDNAFTTEDMCERVYPGTEIEKKHRVSVLRAMEKVATRRGLSWFRSERVGGTIVLYDPLRVMSYAMARLKADNMEGYRNKNKNPMFHSNEADLIAKISPGGKQHYLVIPDGPWWIHTEMYRARMNGDEAGWQKLADDLDASIGARVARIGMSS
jgi:hypothetical protein